MMWTISFIVALFVFLFSVFAVAIFSKQKNNRRGINSLSIILTGVFISSTIIFVPIYYITFKDESCGLIKTFLLSVHNTIRLFVVDGEFDIITENWEEKDSLIYSLYSMFASVLFVLAPILTFGVVLSFFKNISAYIKLMLVGKKELYIFSELNEKSITIAESAYEKKGKKIRIVFTDCFDSNNEVSYELQQRAQSIQAIMFKDDILVVKFKKSKHNKLFFFIIGEDESENINHALMLSEKYTDMQDSCIYIFSNRIESEIIFQNNETKGIKIRRININQSLVLNNLFDNGMKIFNKSQKTDYCSNKQISAVVVGMGSLGTDMAKALTWFCQMDGYDVHINIFDRDKCAKSKFKMLCPELIDDAYNGNFTDDGESKYSLQVHSDVDVEKYEFIEELCKLKEITYVFVSLGSDELNVRTSVKIRMLCERLGLSPFIQSIVYDERKKSALEKSLDKSSQKLDIEYIGDIKSCYDFNVILGNELDEIALKRHCKWGEEDDYWKYEYNRCSSIASVIHSKYKKLCKIPGADLSPEERTEEQRLAMRKLEHRRWNAYMRSEGYVRGEKKNKLAKTHNCLVSFDELSSEEKAKDDD